MAAFLYAHSVQTYTEIVAIDASCREELARLRNGLMCLDALNGPVRRACWGQGRALGHAVSAHEPAKTAPVKRPFQTAPDLASRYSACNVSPKAL